MVSLVLLLEPQLIRFGPRSPHQLRQAIAPPHLLVTRLLEDAVCLLAERHSLHHHRHQRQSCLRPMACQRIYYPPAAKAALVQTVLTHIQPRPNLLYLNCPLHRQYLRCPRPNKSFQRMLRLLHPFHRHLQWR